MSRKYKFFTVSDVHGHCTQLVSALDEAGYDKEDATHVLLVLGDCFDRGSENDKVLEFLEHTERKIVVRGNHEDLLMQALGRGYITACDCHNGTDLTIQQFFGPGSIDAYGRITASGEPLARLERFVSDTKNYYETDRYVFVHGWLPIIEYGTETVVMPMWRQAKDRVWEHARYHCWNEQYRKGSTLRAKTIVCGHRSAEYGYLFDANRSPADTSPFYGDGVIAIDACSVRSGRVNIVVIEDTAQELIWST